MATGPVKAILLWALTLPAVYHDLRWRRVPNILILAGITCGAATVTLGGRSDILQGSCGFVLGFLLLLPFFLLGGVGGGDVKSLAVIGLFTGPSLLLTAFFWGACAGGLAAIGIKLRNRHPLSGEVAARVGRTPHPTLPYAAILFLAAAITLSRAVL